MEIESNVKVMPFDPPVYQFNGHLQTIIPGLFRKVNVPHLIRERWDTPDGDFIDVDWLKTKSKRLAIISHGLEGDSRRPYMLGMLKTLSTNGFSILNWNFRSCSGEINKKVRFYHSGATDDLHFIITKAIDDFNPVEIFLIGFSLGGNLTLKYLGESDYEKSQLIQKAIAISVPIDLGSSCIKMKKADNKPYEIRFLRSLKSKLREKEKMMPGTFDLRPLSRISHLWEFDDYYTGPIHGFSGAQDYYNQCSSINFLPYITVPTVLINAKNDPFLSEECFPNNGILGKSAVQAVYPDKGGHCGFRMSNGKYWSEVVSVGFLQNGW